MDPFTVQIARQWHIAHTIHPEAGSYVTLRANPPATTPARGAARRFLHRGGAAFTATIGFGKMAASGLVYCLRETAAANELVEKTLRDANIIAVRGLHGRFLLPVPKPYCPPKPVAAGKASTSLLAPAIEQTPSVPSARPSTRSPEPEWTAGF